MIQISTIRQQIADHWQSRLPPAGVLFANDDAFAAFYTSKYLIQDTAESVAVHMRRGFSGNPHAAYIEFWGIMQALIIQQDAIVELHKSICDSAPKVRRPSPWFDIRDLRNRCAGHPASNKNSSKGSTLRSFMGRHFGCYEQITYEQYDSRTGKTTHPKINMRELIGQYDLQAAQILCAVLAELKGKCP
jgi:hypothetical protein